MRNLVRYDTRGFGLSQREVTDFSIDAMLLDLEAVADRLGLEKFALLGFVHTGPAAISYAAHHPQRVSHLVLWCTYARGSEWSEIPTTRATRALIEMDWQTYTETLAHVMLGWSAGEPARRYAALIREACTPDVLRAALSATNQFDVSGLLSQVTTPTLVLHRREVNPGVALARQLASEIPNARLAVLEGTSLMPYLGDTEAVLSVIDDFLGEGEPSTAAPVPSGLVTILFTDM